MRVLLASGGFGTAERRALLIRAMRRHFERVRRILFVPWALPDHEGYLQSLCRAGLDAGFDLDGIHRHEDPVRAVEDAEALYVGGGNSFLLAAWIHRCGIREAVRRRVLEEGVPYLGVSAGTNAACPTIQTTNDMPVVQPPSFEAFGLVPFQVNPHYYPGRLLYRRGEELVEHFGETRDDRIREYHEHHDRPVVGLEESGLLWVGEGRVRLEAAPARLFRRGREPVDLAPGEEIPGLLEPAPAG